MLSKRLHYSNSLCFSIDIVFKTEGIEAFLKAQLEPDIPFICYIQNSMRYIACFKKDLKDVEKNIFLYNKGSTWVEMEFPHSQVVLRFIDLHCKDELNKISSNLQTEIFPDKIKLSGEKSSVDHCCAWVYQVVEGMFR